MPGVPQSAPIPGVRRIAVLRANALGDFIFALPALDALRAAYPEAEIVLLARSWHADLLARRPGPVDRVVVVPGDAAPEAAVGGRWSEAPWRAAGEEELRSFADRMRAERFDLAVQLHGGGRNSNPFVRALGARVTIGLRSQDAEPLDRWVRFVYYQQEVLRCLEVVGLAGAPPVGLEPRFASTAEDVAEVLPLLGELRRPFVVFHPGANDPRRRWPPERFAAVGDALAELGLGGVVSGSPAERQLAAAVAGAMRAPSLDLAGSTSLRGLAGLLAEAALVVSNDSGPVHLAGALGRPTVGIYWCGNLINGGPLTRARHRPLISWQVHCPVCGTPSTAARCEHDDSFVTDVAVEEVIDAAIGLLTDLGEMPMRPAIGAASAQTTV
jgi:ADP-heptose:LPS heptosyltransferase